MLGQPAKVVADHRQVGGGEGAGGQVRGGFPGDGDMFARDWRRAAGGELRHKGSHGDGDRFIGMSPGGQGMKKIEFASQFLTNLPLQRRGGFFSCFDLAAGKFPQQAEVFVRRALSDEHEAVPFDERADDGDELAFSHRVSVPRFVRCGKIGMEPVEGIRSSTKPGMTKHAPPWRPSLLPCLRVALRLFAPSRFAGARAPTARARLAGTGASAQGARLMATDFSAKTLSGISLVGRSEGLVKTLGGFRKDRHSVPDAINATTQAFVARLGETELKEESERVFQSARAAMGYKRTDISLGVGGGQAVLTARDFVWELALSQHEADPARYLLMRTLHSLRTTDVARLPEFDGLWSGAFSTLVFALVKGVSVEAVIDAVEGLEPADAHRLQVNYPSDCHECTVTVAGVDAAVRCTGGTLDVEFPHPGTPRELLEKFAEIRDAFVFTRAEALANMM